MIVLWHTPKIHHMRVEGRTERFPLQGLEAALGDANLTRVARPSGGLASRERREDVAFGAAVLVVKTPEVLGRGLHLLYASPCVFHRIRLGGRCAGGVHRHWTV
eukprot:scaffold1572_cov272-Pinguiococcus_pyrenoidosus.AAC.8